jgi:two-component system CheB/CheR fusion protein
MREINGEKDGGLMLVGIGASAGGVDALLRFFEKMPADSGLAFAVVLHTAPGHESRLAEVLQTRTRMPVAQVTESALVERDRVYCVPPDRRVLMDGGHINLDGEESNENGRRAPIDLFFRELARAYKDKAIAVVLSGAGADGSLGLGRVREEGGVSLAQDPSEAEHAAMPRSAIETGWVDFILPVASMPEKLVSLKENAERIQLPPVERQSHNVEEDSLSELLALLRARTRHDFTSYKRTTLLRRIERRLQVTECEDVPAYLSHVRQHPDELQGLLRDLLISVTNFFRDPEAFSRLENEIVPRLFLGKGGSDQIRVWVSGCATGEEAYTHAMLLSEYAERQTNPPALQVFATDIDEDALAHGRNGVYPNTIATDVSPERLKRFFVREGQHYRVKRELREMVLFAPHNILRDPPFSKLNLVSCRNLLIYINRNMQERVLEIFHFALKPDGYLFLGSSESAEGVGDLFTPIDKRHRVFKRHDDGTNAFKAAPPPVAGRWEAQVATIPRPPLAGGRAEPFSYGELHYRMLEALTPPSVLVNDDHDIVHLSESAGRYLHMSGGEPTRNLLKGVHPDMRLELRSLLITAAREDGVKSSRVLINLEGEQRLVRVSARALDGLTAAPGFTLVVFEELDAVAPAAEPEAEDDAHVSALSSSSTLEPMVRQLESELERTRDQLRATVEEYETSTEELKASNEELQAMNEELRSASEELETGKEELQSVNEELTTLNAELREKVEEVGRSNSDLHNLMAATRIGTLFLDRSLRLKLYTPSAQELFNVIPGDIGRPLAHITHSLDYATLVEDAERVLRDLHTIEREVSTNEGRYFIARLLPYRATDDKINGVVLTFTDIHARRRAEQTLRESEEQFRRAIEEAPIPVIMHAEDGEVLQISRAWTELTGYTIEDAPTFDAWLTRAYGDGADSVRRYMHELFRGDKRVLNIDFSIRTRDGSPRQWSFNASSPGTLIDGRRFIIGMALDITERIEAEAALRLSEERLRLVLESATDYAILLMDADGRFTNWNPGAEKVFGFSKAEAVGRTTDLIFTPEDRAAGVPEKELRTADREGRAADERWHARRDGSRVYVSGVMIPLRDGAHRGYAKIARDLTEQEQAQQELRSAWEELEQRVHERTAELASANSALREEAVVRRRVERERLELLRRIVSTQEEERRRISRELHDQLGQSLTALRLKLEGLKDEAGKRSKLQGRIAELADVARRLDSDVDFLAWELRPTALDDLGLIVALSNYAQEWSKQFNLKVNFHSAGLGDARLAPLAESNLYRIAQEALNNVAKHSGATSVDMLLERRDDHLVLIVEDNGRGFDHEEQQASDGGRGMGLVSMRERAALVGGSVEIESKQGDGTTVFVRTPVRFAPTEGLEDEEGRR